MIYLIRHGLDNEKYIGGWSDVDLTCEGKKQVESTLDILKKLDIRQIISSDVRRAITTSQIINECLKVPITYTPLLRELNKGNLNGAIAANVDLTNYKDINAKYPNGESMMDFYERIKNNLEEILKYDQCLLVTHRGVINMIYYILNEIPVDTNKTRFNVDHASIHEVDIKKKVVRRIR